MSGHWIFACPKGRYVGTRKNNGNMYEARPTLADSLADARVFNTKGAASSAGSAARAKGEAVAVILSLAAASPASGPTQTLDAINPSPTRPTREEVAREIDPEAWDEISADDNEEVAAIFAEAWEDALFKADAIDRLYPGTAEQDSAHEAEG